MLRALFFIGVLIGALIGALIGSCAHAAEVEWFVEYDHTSDIFRGKPFNDQDEMTIDYIGGGFTITAGKHNAWAIDISHGLKSWVPATRNERNLHGKPKWEPGSKLAVRFYPGRLR